MSDDPRIHRSRRNVLLSGALLLLLLGTRVFSQAPDPSAAPPADPMHEVLVLRKAALEAEIKAASARIAQALRRVKNAKAGSRTGLQSDDYIMNAEADLADRQAIVARKRVELKQTTNRLEGFTRSSPEEGSMIDVTDDLLRRIKDLEARVDRIEASGRESRLRSPGVGNRSLPSVQPMILD